jgi:small-conductance mechanosensitive channel
MTFTEFIGDVRIWSAGIFIGAVVAGIAAHAALFAVLARGAARMKSSVTDLIVRYCRRPGYLMFPTVAVLIAWPSLALPDEIAVAGRRAVVLLFVFSIGWAIVAVINVVGDFVAGRHAIDHADNLDARRIQTQTQVLRRIGVVLTVLVTAGIMLMSIPSVHHIGVSLFASAGVAGLAVGLAARATLSNIVAGIQVALTQPIRIEDVVIVEGEWGWIEEIRTTYVVVRIWDLRRLVVPISYFIEKPYQNWTRTTADILGSVFLHVDYHVPFEALRSEFRRILEGSGMWDGKVCVMHVTEAKERTVEIRMLMSAPSSPQAWELRCHVREKLIEFVRDNYPDSLPRLRAEVRKAA